MEFITYKNIKVTGIEYKHIIELAIEQKVGEHTKALLVLEVSEYSKKGNNYVDSTIQILNKKNEKCLFYGIVVRDYHAKEYDYPAVILELSSMSRKLDLKPVTATYQQKEWSYRQLMEKVVGNDACISYGITDSKINSWVYRNNETTWEFVKRLASQSNACVFTNMTSKVPKISIGKTDIVLDKELEVFENYEEGGKVVNLTNEVLEIGMKISNGQYVTYAKTYLKKGVLVTEYTIGDADSIKQPVYYNSQSECRMLTGVVRQVQENKVQVFFDSIDSEFDESGDCWFDYATPYSNTFYCMPEVDDRIRVFLPSADEGKAFAFGAVSDSTMTNPKFSEWKMPGQQQILFTDKGIRISCKDESVYIDLKSTDGIKVWSKSGITMEKADSIVIEGKKGVTLYADEHIGICASNASLNIENDKIIFRSTELRMEN